MYGTCRRRSRRRARPLRRLHQHRNNRARDSDDVRRIQQRQIRHVVVVDQTPRQARFLRRQPQRALQLRERAVRMVHDELAVHLADEGELALAELGRVAGEDVGPELPRLAHHEPYVLRALFHLAGEVESRCHDQVRVRPPHFDFGVEAPHVDLGCCQGLLSDGHALSQPVQLLAEVDIEQTPVGERILRYELPVFVFELFAHGG